MKRILWAPILALPLIALLAAGFGHDPNAISSPLVNKRAPALTLTSFGGRTVALRALHGKPVVVNFWASWCTSCKAEHQSLLDAFRVYHRAGVQFVGVDYQDNLGDAQSFLKRYGDGWPELRDPDQHAAINFGVYGVPETFFIDRNGVVRYKQTGPVTVAVLQRQIDRLLRTSS